MRNGVIDSRLNIMKLLYINQIMQRFIGSLTKITSNFSEKGKKEGSIKILMTKIITIYKLEIYV